MFRSLGGHPQRCDNKIISVCHDPEDGPKGPKHIIWSVLLNLLHWMAYYSNNYYPDTWFEEQIKTTRKFNHDNRCNGWDSNRALPEYESEALLPGPICSVSRCDIQSELLYTRNSELLAPVPSFAPITISAGTSDYRFCLTSGATLQFNSSPRHNSSITLTGNNRDSVSFA
jgi:hypothetical protein